MHQLSQAFLRNIVTKKLVSFQSGLKSLTEAWNVPSLVEILSQETTSSTEFNQVTFAMQELEMCSVPVSLKAFFYSFWFTNNN